MGTYHTRLQRKFARFSETPALRGFALIACQALSAALVAHL